MHKATLVEPSSNLRWLACRLLLRTKLRLLQRSDVCSLVPFCDLERNFLVSAKAPVTIALNRQEVCEDVFAAAVWSDKAKTLRVAEPLNHTRTHALHH